MTITSETAIANLKKFRNDAAKAVADLEVQGEFELAALVRHKFLEHEHNLERFALDISDSKED